MMKKFDNLTLIGNEKSIKIGRNVPDGAVGLGLFSMSDISPSNNLVITDLSGTIPENSLNRGNSEFKNSILIADELGFLHTEDGNYTFPSSDVLISDVFLSKKTDPKLYSFDELNPDDFVYYYYISRYFTPSPPNFSLLSMEQWIDPNSLSGLNIKVTDENGFDFIDPNTGRKKYRFLLDPFNTSTNVFNSEIPYRIVVLLDSTSDRNLKLVYDKVECDEDGNMFSVFLNYSETINPVPFFTKIPEESFVIDDNYRNDRIFSVKKIQDKYNEIVLNRPTDTGYQIVAPKKALDDSRQFEVFNWRFIARTRKSINYSITNAGDDLDTAINGLARTIKVGVLYSSSLQESNNTIAPYIFNRLMNSPFNMVEYNFINPITEIGLANGSISSEITKNHAEYWKVDIDLLDSDLNQFDVLAWAPSSSVTENQSVKLANFIGNNGTLILDLSMPGANMERLHGELRIDPSPIVGQYFEASSTNVLTDYTKNNAWNLANNVFEKENYSLFGSNYIEASDTYKTYLRFDTSLNTDNAFFSAGPTSSNLSKIGVIIPFVSSDASALTRGNIIATTFPLMSYCNSIYEIGSYDKVRYINDGSYDASTEGDIYSGVIEGPMKLLFNSITYAAYCRLQASSEIRTNSTVYNYVSKWYSAWTINQDVLLEDEKFKYFKPIADSDRLGFDLLPEKKIHEEYLSLISEILPPYQRDQIFDIDSSNIEFFIEVTNPDVYISNSTIIDPSSYVEEVNIPSSYTLFRVDDPLQKVLAYTNVDSPPLEVPSGFGAYVVKEKALNVSDPKSLINNLSILNNFRAYPYQLTSRYGFVSGEDTPLALTVNGTLTYNAVFKGTYSSTDTIFYPPTAEIVEVTATKSCQDFFSTVDNGAKVFNSSNPLNTFIYTGDINIHKQTKTWKATYASSSTSSSSSTSQADVSSNLIISTGVYSPIEIYQRLGFASASALSTDLLAANNNSKVYTREYASYSCTRQINGNIDVKTSLISGAPSTSTLTNTNSTSTSTSTVTSSSAPTTAHEYVKYIQFTTSTALNRPLRIDGIFGSNTTSVVREFQKTYQLRYQEGTVDSETKSYMAWFWKSLKSDNLTKYNQLINRATSDSNLSVIVKYITAAVNAGTVSEIGKKTYKKLTFSGFSGPSQATDILIFKLPDTVNKVENITIEAGGDKAWQNFSVDIYGYSSNPITDIFKTTNKKGPGIVKDGKIVIPFNNISGVKARYVWIQVVGGKLSDYGSDYGFAEGFAIKAIRVKGKFNSSEVVPGVSEDVTKIVDIWGIATIEAPILNKNINVDKEFNKTFVRSNVPRRGSTITALTIGCNSAGSFNGGVPFKSGEPYYADLTTIELSPEVNDTSDHIFDVDGIKIDFSKRPSSFQLTSFNVDSVYEQGLSRETTNVTASVTSNSLSISTSAIAYAGLIHTVDNNLTSGFYLRKATDAVDIYAHTPNTININDGVVLLCTDTGAPFGLISDMAPYIQSVQNSLLGRDLDTRLGSISVRNDLGEIDGMIYGLYDLSKKEFIGKRITYIDLINRGVNNVYIGLAAFDADGNIHDNNEFFGPKIDMNFVPARIPTKTISPIFSVKFENSSLIKVGQIDPHLSKFEAWTLPVSAGQFNKLFNISSTRYWSSWHKYYVGQNLIGYYSTSEIDTSVWSKIYGVGYYDVIDETPILVDNRSIQLRRVPLLNIEYPTDRFGIAGTIRQDLSIYKRDTIESEWNLISYSQIKDVNSHNGVISFKSSIIPSDPDLVKVSYVTSDKNIHFRHINGNPIPLNPLLNKNDINFDDPLFVYLMPKSIYKNRTISLTTSGNIAYPHADTNEEVAEYQYTSSVNFTYDKSIFDSRSATYEPFALPIAIITCVNNPFKEKPRLVDIRVRGGGIVDDRSISELEEQASEVLSYWDVFPPMGEAYAKGGYVIIRIPASVKDHFLDEKEIYQIISNNLTAGIAFELQDMDGNSWN